MSDVAVNAADLLAAAPRRKRAVSGVIGLCFLVAAGVVGMAAFGPMIAPHDPSAQDLAVGLSKPSRAHWLGTDDLGRDIFSRLIVGARTAVIGPLVIAVGSMVVGNLLGLLAGYRRKSIDWLIMRWVDLMWAVPALLVIIVVAGTLGGGYWVAVVLLFVLTVPFDARVIRGVTLEQTPRPYVEAAKTLGVSDWRIMVFHIWPNVSATAVANTFLVFAGALVSLSSLAYLGIGVAPGTPDWGLMLAEGQSFLLLNPVATLAPGAMIAITATAASLIGDWLYEKLSSTGATR